LKKKLGQLCILKSSSQPTVEEPDDNHSQIVVHSSVSNTTTTIVTTTNNSLNPINQQNINSISTTVSTGGQFISHGILVGADKLSKHIESGAEKLKGFIDPNETPAQVPDNIKHTLSVAKRVTPLLVDISGMLVKSVHTVVKGVGSIAAEQIKQKMKESNSQVDFEDPKVIAAKNLGRTTANAIITIWNSLEDAGMVLISSTGKATVNVVNHKYGQEAAKVTADGFSVAQDVVQTGATLKTMGVKGIVKGVAKETTKNLIGLEEEQNKALPPATPQNLLLPATPNKTNK